MSVDWTPDQRDSTPEPPALLDPQMILECRKMLPKAILGTMEPWPYGCVPKEDKNLARTEK